MQNLSEATIEFGVPAKRASLMWPKNIACVKSAPPLCELNFQRKPGALKWLINLRHRSSTTQFVAARFSPLAENALVALQFEIDRRNTEEQPV
jgi:hypothetical protein